MVRPDPVGVLRSGRLAGLAVAGLERCRPAVADVLCREAPAAPDLHRLVVCHVSDRLGGVARADGGGVLRAVYRRRPADAAGWLRSDEAEVRPIGQDLLGAARGSLRRLVLLPPALTRQP